MERTVAHEPDDAFLSRDQGLVCSLRVGPKKTFAWFLEASDWSHFFKPIGGFLSVQLAIVSRDNVYALVRLKDK